MNSLNSNKKKIGIDARLYFQTGVGTYIQNLLTNLQNIAPKNYTFYVYVLTKDGDKIRFVNKQFIKREAPFQWHSISEQTGFLKILNRDGLDLMHFTYFSYPILYLCPFVATIHDITPIQFKTGKASTKNLLFYSLKHSVYQYVLKNQVLNARAIIAPTNTVKDQIVEQYGKEYAKKITVTYEGISKELINAKENNLINKFQKPFYIYVGNFYPHKNIKKLIQAFANTKIAARLILIGPNDYFTTQMTHCINTMSQQKRIVIHATNNLGDLKFFYKNALALIHPSLSEGFGLPLIEAAYFNCPIIGSDISVFKELLGNQFLKFDPNNVNDMIKIITKFDQKPMKFSYSNILKKCSFPEMTKKTLDVYQKSL